MHQRINITLPEETIRLIARVAENGDRSRFINEAVTSYIKEVGRANLRKRLKEGAIHEAELDRRGVDHGEHRDSEKDLIRITTQETALLPLLRQQETKLSDLGQCDAHHNRRTWGDLRQQDCPGRCDKFHQQNRH